MRRLRIFLIVFLAGACATPIGQIPDSELAWRETILPRNYQEVYRNLQEGFRRCYPQSPVGTLYTDIPEARIDIYLQMSSVFTGWQDQRSAHALGYLTLRGASNGGTVMREGLRPRWAEAWNGILSQWAMGDFPCGKWM